MSEDEAHARYFTLKRKIKVFFFIFPSIFFLTPPTCWMSWAQLNIYFVHLGENQRTCHEFVQVWRWI